MITNRQFEKAVVLAAGKRRGALERHTGLDLSEIGIIDTTKHGCQLWYARRDA